MSESKEKKIRITLESFVGELSWLFEVKKKRYHDKEVELLYHICKEVNEFELKKAVRSAALANKTLPSMNELLKHITPRIHKLNESERKVEADNLKKNNSERCKMCDNGGSVSAYDTETKYRYAFRCECPFGQQRSKQIPLWSESRKPRFVVLNDINSY